MTTAEFLAWDGGGHVGKLELVDGVVRAIAPASATHGIIQGNLITAINIHLRSSGSRCRAATEAPVIPPFGKRANARAPDVTVTCVPASASPTFDDPLLIVEVLSPGNESETWESIRALAALTSLKEILVVQSTLLEASVYKRGPTGGWPMEPSTALAGGMIRLDSLDFELPLAEIYAGTHLLSA